MPKIKEKNKGWRSLENLRRAERCPKPHEPVKIGPGKYECQLCGMQMPGAFVEGYQQGIMDAFVKGNRMASRRGIRGVVNRVRGFFKNG